MVKINLFKIYKNHGENYLWRSIQTFGKMGLEFIILYIVARLLTPIQFGDYSYLMAVIGIFIIFGEFGLSASVSRFIVEYETISPQKVKDIIFSTFILCIIFSSAVSVVLYLLSILFFTKIFEFILIFIPLIFLISLVNVFDGIYRGLKNFKKLSFISISSGIIVLPISFFLITLFDIIGALSFHGIYYLTLFILLFKSIHEKNYIFDKKLAKKVLNYAFVIGFANLAYFLYTNIDILILESYGFIIEISYYRIVNSIFNFIFVPFIILGQILAPSITQMATKKRFALIKKYLNKLPYIFILGFIISFLSVFFFPFIITILFPEYYNENILIIWNVLLYLIPFKIFGVILIQAFVVPTGFGKLTFYLTAIGGVFNVGLDFLFINLFGFIGVFYSTVLVHSLTIIFTFIIFYIRNLEKVNVLK